MILSTNFAIFILFIIQFSPGLSEYINNERLCVCFEDIYASSNFTSPVDIVNIPGYSDLYYVLEQKGTIQILNSTSKNLLSPFLDLTTTIIPLSVSTSDPRGLFSLALSPDYGMGGGYYYVSYSGQSGGSEDHRDVIAEFFTTNPLAGNSSSKRELMSIPHTYINNNGGYIGFGPDGLLYISLGDGGGNGDPDDNAESTTSLLGSILRINPDPLNTTARLGEYDLPTDNPFYGAGGGVKEEIWAYGFRNSPVCAFDNTTFSPPGTTLFTCAEHGLNHEEVNFIMNGSDYGWNTLDAQTCYQPPIGCSASGKESPIQYFKHSAPVTQESISVLDSLIGGHFWSDAALPAGYFGKYLFAGEKGPLFTLNTTFANTSAEWTRKFVCTTSHSPTCVSEFAFENVVRISRDNSGNLFLINSDSGSPYYATGTVYRVSPSDSCTRVTCDQQELGLFPEKISSATHIPLILSLIVILLFI